MTEKKLIRLVKCLVTIVVEGILTTTLTLTGVMFSPRCLLLTMVPVTRSLLRWVTTGNTICVPFVAEVPRTV